MKAVAIVSGGMDSTTLAYQLHDEADALTLCSFNYGQRHRRELDFARATADDLGVPWVLLDLTSLAPHIGTSALTSEIDVPDGHYAEETMRITVVPNRNMVMLALAASVAIGRDADTIAFGAHAGDHFIYPDCRPAFVAALGAALDLATEGFASLRIHAPFLDHTKADIAKLGARLGVPWDRTWSCYRGEELHCGRCGTCVERIEAFRLAEVADPTVYEDTAFVETVL